MIIELFVALTCLSLGLVALGYFTDTEMYQYIGLAFLMIIGAAILTGGITYAVGNTIVTNGSTITVTDTYSTYTNRSIGFFIVLAGALGIVLVEVKRRGDEE